MQGVVYRRSPFVRIKCASCDRQILADSLCSSMHLLLQDSVCGEVLWPDRYLTIQQMSEGAVGENLTA